MSAESVFCPKCGQQSISGDRFCKRCGTNLETISKVLTGALPVASNNDAVAVEMEIEYAKEISTAIYNLVGSLLTFAVLMFVFKGSWWVYFLLFWVADSVRDLIQASILKNQIKNPAAFHAAIEAYKDRKGKKKRRRRDHSESEVKELPAAPDVARIPPTPVSLFADAKAPTTGELHKPEGYVFDAANPPASVTEGTTRLLEEEARAREDESPRYSPPNRSVSQ